MRIISIDPTPLHTLAYRTAAPSGGILQATFPVLRGIIDRLPDGCQALVACSDLQGLADTTGADGTVTTRLLGEALSDELGVLAEHWLHYAAILSSEGIQGNAMVTRRAVLRTALCIPPMLLLECTGAAISRE